MNKKNIIAIGAVLTAVIAVLGLTASSYAHSFNQGDFNHRIGAPSPDERLAIHNALENNDYQAWKKAVGSRPVSSKITSENFSQFVQAHKLREEGKYDEAEAIFRELDLPRRGGGFGKMRGMMGHRGAHFIDENHDGVCDYLDRLKK